MNNFHYRAPQNNPKNDKNMKLLEQLQMIDRELEQDNRKLAEKKKLEEEFYEDSKRMNLADEIMDELLNKKPKTNNYAGNQQKIVPDSYEPTKISPLAQEGNFHERKNNFKPQPQVSPPSAPKQQQYVNPRQLQKIKLQNHYAQQEFPFGGNSREKDQKIKNDQKNQIRIQPERQAPLRNNYLGARVKPEPQKIQNPFLKNEQMLKQRRQQEEKQYRRLLEQQMELQKRKKQQEKQKYKQQIQQKFNSYVPASGVINSQSPQNEVKPAENGYKKRRDPNGQYVSLEKPSHDIRSSDIEYMKLQAQDLKTKFKKGRINHEEYEQQIKKLQSHYKMKIEDIVQEENNQINKPKAQIRESEKPVYSNVNVIVNSSERIKNSGTPSSYEQGQKRQIETSIKPTLIESNQYQQNYQPYNNISSPIDSMRPPQPYPNYSHYYHQHPPPVAPAQPDFQMQMMWKILEEFKSLFKMQTEASINDKKVLQDTLTKMIPSVNPIMHTQQVPSHQLPPPQKQFQTEVKRAEKHESIHKNPQIPDYSKPSQSEISSSYIQKSMSGIVNKIPLTKRQKQDDKIDPSRDVIEFYSRKYKVKKFQSFQYNQVQNYSNQPIPTVSNFVQTKNSHNQLNEAFEIDLRNYKKLQKQKDMQLMMERIKKSKESDGKNSPKKQIKADQTNTTRQAKNIYHTESVPQLQVRPAKQQQGMVNPFLKKHISNESSHQAQSQPKPDSQKVKMDLHYISSPATKYQILEQQQYQTQQKKNESPTNRARAVQVKKNQQHKNQKEGSKEYPSSKILNTVKANNQILAKYQMTPPSHLQNSQQHIGSNSLSSIKEAVKQDTSKQISSREYFSGHEISPVQRREYQSSLETVRSEEESAKFQRKNNMDLLILRSGGQSSNFESQYQSPHILNSYSVQGSPTIESIEIEKRQQPSIQRQPSYPHIGYSQTVESIEESQSKLPTFQRPPNNSRKSGRSVSRKKESIIKLGDNFQKSGLSGIPSQGSKERSSENRNLSEYQNLSKMESPKFDSAVYQSGYEQSMSLAPTAKKPDQIEMKNQSQLQESKKSVPSSFKQVLNENRLSAKHEQKSSLQNFSGGKFQQQESVLAPKQTPSSITVPKLKSLDEARKIARQFKQRSNEDHNKSSVEQKLSSLQSLQVSKKDESIYRPSRREEATTNKKKDIMKILDDLGEEQYQPDFDSYKEESER